MKNIFGVVILIIILLGVGAGAYYYIFSNTSFEQELYVIGDGNSQKPESNRIVFPEYVFNIVSSNHPTDVFESILDNGVTYVFYFTGSSWDWYDFRDNTGSLITIEPTETYYVYVTQDCVLNIS